MDKHALLALLSGTILLTQLPGCASRSASNQSTQSPPPVQTAKPIVIAPEPRQSPSKPIRSQSDSGNSSASGWQELDQIFSSELALWKRDYANKKRLASSCPAPIIYAYGLRLIQPSTFRGDYAELVRQRYGNGPEFLVIATADGGAAAQSGILPGDRLTRVASIDAREQDAAKRLALESRRWRQSYNVLLERDGKQLQKRLQPDKLCDLKL